MKTFALIISLVLCGCHKKGPSASDKAELLKTDKTSIDEALQIMGKPDRYTDMGGAKFWYYEPWFGYSVTIMFLNGKVATVSIH